MRRNTYGPQKIVVWLVLLAMRRSLTHRTCKSDERGGCSQEFPDSLD